MFSALRWNGHAPHEAVDVPHPSLIFIVEDLAHVLVVVRPLRWEWMRVREFVTCVRVMRNLVILDHGPDLAA